MQMLLEVRKISSSLGQLSTLPHSVKVEDGSVQHWLDFVHSLQVKPWRHVPARKAASHAA